MKHMTYHPLSYFVVRFVVAAISLAAHNAQSIDLFEKYYWATNGTRIAVHTMSFDQQWQCEYFIDRKLLCAWVKDYFLPRERKAHKRIMSSDGLTTIVREKISEVVVRIENAEDDLNDMRKNYDGTAQRAVRMAETYGSLISLTENRLEGYNKHLHDLESVALQNTIKSRATLSTLHNQALARKRFSQKNTTHSLRCVY